MVDRLYMHLLGYGFYTLLSKTNEPLLWKIEEKWWYANERCGDMECRIGLLCWFVGVV
jgi:hypothetical protein